MGKVKLKKDTYVQKNQTIPWDYIIYAICLDNDVEVGRIVFRYGTNEQLKYCGHIGYHIDEMYRGHGYAYQGLCLLMPLLYDEGFRQLRISVAYHNIASQKTVEKLPIITKYLDQDVQDSEYQAEDGLWIYEIEVNK